MWCSTSLEPWAAIDDYRSSPPRKDTPYVDYLRGATLTLIGRTGRASRAASQPRSILGFATHMLARNVLSRLAAPSTPGNSKTHRCIAAPPPTLKDWKLVSPRKAGKSLDVHSLQITRSWIFLHAALHSGLLPTSDLTPLSPLFTTYYSTCPAAH